jgi:hypothetical protein
MLCYQRQDTQFLPEHASEGQDCAWNSDEKIFFLEEKKILKLPQHAKSLEAK